MTDPKTNLMAWVTEHYDTDNYVDVDGRLYGRCRRCGEPVGWLTKHAVERHGDPIDVIPPRLDADAAAVATY